MNRTAPVFTWKRLLALGVIHLSTVAFVMRIAEDGMPLPVLGYPLSFILAVLGLTLTLSIASDLDEAADRKRVAQAAPQGPPAEPAQGVVDPQEDAAGHRLSGDVVEGNDGTGPEHLGGTGTLG
jgi:hypothetical protein